MSWHPLRVQHVVDEGRDEVLGYLGGCGVERIVKHDISLRRGSLNQTGAMCPHWYVWFAAVAHA
jgi:hypothetical protein